MNSLKRLPPHSTMLSIFLLLSTSLSHADVKMLDDNELADLSGQAGLTIDTSTFMPAAEFEYVDITQLNNLPQIHIGGHGSDGSIEKAFYTSQLDNMRINLSVADNSVESSDEGYSFGFSEWRNIAGKYLAKGNELSKEEFEALSSGVDATRDDLLVDDRRHYEEGDLIIHMGYLDPWEKDGGLNAYQQGAGISGSDFETAAYGEAEALVSRSVDFRYSIAEVDLAYASNLAGAATVQSVRSLDSHLSDNTDSSDHKSTRLMSNFSVEGYLGPHDLHIKEFDTHDQSGSTQDLETGLTWNSFFRITDLDVYLDLKGMQISNLQVHNDRGDRSGLNLDTYDSSVGNSSFGFAHAEREIFSFEEEYRENILDKPDPRKKRKGIMFNTRFKGDMDIAHISFGDTGDSIGSFYMTDMYFDTRLKIVHR